MGATHSRAYRQLQTRFDQSDLEPRLVVCADNVEARAREGQRKFGFEKYVTDWRQGLDDADVEAVNITAPNHLHVTLAQAAAEAGKHIFCEKPVGRSPSETAAIEHAARKAGVMTFVGYCYRWAPLVQYALSLIEQGRLGELTHYRGRYFAGYGSDPNSVLSWRFKRQEAGMGSLADLMSHVLDMAQMLAGPLNRVVAAQNTFITHRPLATPGEGTHFSTRQGGPQGDVTNEDYVALLGQFANGARGTFEACRVIVGPENEMTFEIHGTKGSIRWDLQRMNELELCLPGEHEGRSGYMRIYSGPQHPFHANFNPGNAVGLGYEDLLTIEMHQFLTSIAEDKQCPPGFTEALTVAKVQAAAMRSWQSGCWQPVTQIDIDAADS